MSRDEYPYCSFSIVADNITLAIRVFISVHNLLTMWVTMWAEFRSHCDSQYQMTSGIFSQYLHIPIFCLDRAMISNSNCQLVLIIWGWEITVFLQDKEESRAKFTIEMILMKFWDTFVSWFCQFTSFAQIWMGRVSTFCRKNENFTLQTSFKDVWYGDKSVHKGVILK